MLLWLVVCLKIKHPMIMIHIKILDIHYCYGMMQSNEETKNTNQTVLVCLKIEHPMTTKQKKGKIK